MQRHSTGSVLIITLWTITLLTILVTALASQTRLNAQVAWYHKQDVQLWADTLTAVNQAEMELMLERQPRPVFEGVDNPSEIDDNRLYRFNGNELDLYYPQPEGVRVRIYDHGGKINLREVSRPRMRGLLEKLLGEDEDERIDGMMDAWSDWLDLSDQAAVNGAEKDYYLEQELPYLPRNGQLETVEELLHIKGFAEAFAGINLEAAFTVYGGENELVNLNTATVEAMRLLPGLDDDLIRQIVAYRQESELRGNGDVAQIVPAESMAELRPWLNSRKTTNFYTIMVYRDEVPAEKAEDAEAAGISDNALPVTAYAEIVEVNGNSRRPTVRKIMPYQALPVTLDISDVTLRTGTRPR